MVFDEDDLEEIDPYECYNFLLNKHSEQVIPKKKLLELRGKAASTNIYIDLVKGKFYVVVYLRKKFFDFMGFEIPLVPEAIFSVDRFDGVSGKRKNFCEFKESAQLIQSYGVDWFVLRLI